MVLWMMVLGIATGMRTMTPIAIFCWFMWLALLPVTGVTFWAANAIAVFVFSVFMVGEWYGDTLPKTPDRTSIFPLLARLLFGAFVGALVASTYQEPRVGGIIFGVVGALIGTYGGHKLRAVFAKRVGRDLPVALTESALAVVFSVVAFCAIHADIVRQAHEAVVVTSH
jgi:uncharacterized membrane protein